MIIEENAREMVKRIEEHTGEKLECSRRFMLNLTSNIQRIIDKNNGTHHKIERVLEGFNVYDPKEEKAIRKPEREK